MTEAQKIIAKGMSEAELQDCVVKLAENCGWMVHAERPARTATGWRTAIIGSAGFFNLVLVNERRVLFVELKSETGKLTVEQQEWQRVAKLAHYPGAVLIWRPSNWLSGEIESILKG